MSDEKRNECACTHDLSSHYKEPLSSGKAFVPHACLATWCECAKFAPRYPSRAALKEASARVALADTVVAVHLVPSLPIAIDMTITTIHQQRPKP